VWYNEKMECVYLDFEFNPAAFKHGVTEADIRHAFEHRLSDHPVAREEYKHLLLGFDRHLNLLEILYNGLVQEPG
jgi:hypothetical protein